MVELNSLFRIEYGNQFDLSKMALCVNEVEHINFVSRASKNFGVVARVEKFNLIDPYPSGLITVTLGGTYVLSSFIQPAPFYTAQNVKVLIPRKRMSFNEKLFYCKCIESNRFRYSSHGREANVTLDSLQVPSHMPSQFKKISLHGIESKIARSVINSKIELHTESWKCFRYEELFNIERGAGARKEDVSDQGQTVFITSTKSNNGMIGKVDALPAHQGNTITVSRNGSVGDAFYQAEPFCSTEDVHVFNPKFAMNKYIAMFMLPLIRKEAFKYNYGRKWSLKRMNDSLLKLPIRNESIDFEFMENYIKSLPFSSNL